MKALFAVNNESISETIIKKYQKIYDDLLEYKNVYYYNAIVKEIQKQKDYDVIVISEDLETISSTDKGKVDAFLLDKLEKIIDVFKVEEIEPIPILFISNEKRAIKDEMIPNMFNLGIYGALVGKDRTITKICELIHSPRTIEQARAYYNLGTEANPGFEKEIVNPKEINNILRHYKKILVMPDRFSSSFDRIAAQYDDIQLKYIIDKLPAEVKTVLEKENPKYKEMLSFKKAEVVEQPTIKVEAKPTTDSAVVIPTEINRKKVISQTKTEPEVQIPVIEEPVVDTVEIELPEEPEIVVPLTEESVVETVEIELPEETEIVVPIAEETEIEIPTEEKKDTVEVAAIEEPAFEEIVIEGLDDDDLDIFADPILDDDEEFIPIFGEEETEDADKEELEQPVEITLDKAIEDAEEITLETEGAEEPKTEVVAVEEPEVGLELSDLGDDINIFGDELLIEPDEEITLDLEAEEIPEIVIPTEEEEHTVLQPSVEIPVVEIPTPNVLEDKVEIEKDLVTQNKKDFVAPDLSAVLSKDKKVVIFVGTSKNGTSFLVNSLGMMFASIGINTAILDMTKNRNSYYLATKNDERLRQIAVDSTAKLREGVAMGVDVVRGLSVYTALPGEKDTFSDSEAILSTLVKNYSLVLIDADFNTNFGYFSAAQEIYLVQSLDVLTIQPLTAFLKELLDAGVLTTEKVKVVLNKEVAVRGLTRKLLVGGISTYNDPAMSIMTNLFDRNLVQVASIPFDQNVYSKYLENIVECKYDISGYPKKFVEALKVLANMVYPLISKQRDGGYGGSPSSQPTPQVGTGPFTNDMSSTLDQMRRRL